MSVAPIGKVAGEWAYLSSYIAPFASGDIAGMLCAAVRARRNILVSGGTSTGKTTFLNALIRDVPVEERLILIEDTPRSSWSTPTPSNCSRRAARWARLR